MRYNLPYDLAYRPILAVITDLDGTALSSELRIEAAQNVLRDRHGLTVSKSKLVEFAEQMGSFAFPKLFRITDLPEEGAKDFAAECLEKFEAAAESCDNPGAFVSPGFPQFMQYLKRTKTPTIACTNAENGIAARDTAGLVERASLCSFNAVYYSGMSDPHGTGHKLAGKPAPDMMIAAFRGVAGETTFIGAKSKQQKPVVLVFGDQAADSNAAAAAAPFVERHGADVVFISITGATTPHLVQEREAHLLQQGRYFSRDFRAVFNALLPNASLAKRALRAFSL